MQRPSRVVVPANAAAVELWGDGIDERSQRAADLGHDRSGRVAGVDKKSDPQAKPLSPARWPALISCEPSPIPGRLRHRPARLLEGALEQVPDTELFSPPTQVVVADVRPGRPQHTDDVRPLAFGRLAARPEPLQLRQHRVFRRCHQDPRRVGRILQCL
jgi:hypothetical protein